MTAIDTNVLLDIVLGIEPHASTAIRTLDEVGDGLVVAPIVVAELVAHPGWNPDDVEPFLGAVGARIDWTLDRAIWLRAGQAYGAYARRRKRATVEQTPRRLIADFVIGAHAEYVGSLLTRDALFYKRNFAGLKIVEPQ